MTTIKIYMEGGVITDVLNLPPNYNYEIVDYDCLGDCEPICLACKEKSDGDLDSAFE